MEIVFDDKAYNINGIDHGPYLEIPTMEVESRGRLKLRVLMRYFAN